MTNSNVHVTPPRGVHDGSDGSPARAYRRRASGDIEELPGYHRIRLLDGELIVSVSCSGGGYGAPEGRDPERVARHVSEGWITRERAEAIYRVALTAEGAVDEALTERMRAP